MSALLKEVNQIDVRKGDWMVTASGQKFYPLDPRPEDVHIEDIAHALAMNNRFNGHTVRPYSVGLHSLLCSQWVEGAHAMTALLHDATEAYLADVVRPAKRGMPEYMKIEKDLWEKAIAPRFGLPLLMPEEVHTVDNRMLVTEAGQLMGPSSPLWWEGVGWPQPFDLKIPELSWEEVRDLFLTRFRELDQQN